jgi:Fe2+ or Zn2+ uptake regulation protein
MKKTKNREKILAVLLRSKGALSASDIQKHLPRINLATIYRNLETFVNHQQVKKLSFADEARFEIQKTPHHHAICNNCKEVIHFTLNDKKLIREFALPDFTIEDIEITIRGKCRKKKCSLDKKDRTQPKQKQKSK